MNNKLIFLANGVDEPKKWNGSKKQKESKNLKTFSKYKKKVWSKKVLKKMGIK